MSRTLRDVGFVHLHVHSSYSLLESALTIDRLKTLALKDRMPALALTDTNNLFGALEFSEKLAGAGIQPIVGIELAVAAGDEASPRPGQPPATLPGLVLLAMDDEGQANLIRLASRAFLSTQPGDPPHVALGECIAHAAGLIALTGGPDGPISRALEAGRGDLAEARLRHLRAAFGDRLYVELQRHGTDAERAVEPGLLDLAYRLGLPLVAANEPYYSGADDFEAHDALLAIAEGRIVDDPARRRLTSEHGFKSRADMLALFRDLPEATANSVEIAMRCTVRPRTQRPILPRYSVGADGAAVDEPAELRRQAGEGLAARLAAHGPAPGLTPADYTARLDFELSVIERMNYPGYS